jgi:uncharacterized protein
MKKTSIILLLGLLFSAQSFAQKTSLPFPKFGSWISDTEGLFTPQQQKELNLLLAGYENRTNNEIAIITVKTIAPYNSVAEFSTDLSNKWSMGRDDTKNSLLIIVSKTLGQVRITTAYGTEKLIRNETCKKIINTDMLPAYAEGNYFAGTKQGLISLMKEWN